MTIYENTSELSIDAWDAAWRGIGATPPAAEVHAQVLAAYAQRHRAYHTLQHLHECLALLATTRGHGERPDEIALALWFHDAIYLPRRRDNEARSADWLARVALDAGAAADVVARLHGLVLDTRHAIVPQGRDAQLLIDIDLAILGAAPARFDEYEAQIRREYRWAPAFLYRPRRRQVLAEFLARASIYSTPDLHASRENEARANLMRSIAALDARA